MQPELSIMSQDKFISTIERIVIEKNMSYLDAIMHVCESVGIEVEMVPRLITPRIKKILTSEANELNLLKRRANEPRLPI
jgi:hypothetical protein